MPKSESQFDTRVLQMLADPSYFLWRFDGRHAMFVEMDRAAFQRSIFLDGRISPAQTKAIPVDLTQVIQAHNSLAMAPSEIRYIFHVAHCGSTLLARALDFEQTNLVYREPQALRQLAATAAGGGYSEEPPEDWLQKLNLATSLLGRPFNSGPVIVKANVPVNFIIPHVMGAGANTRGIILYATLENYLLSVLKTQSHQKWVTQIVNVLGPSIDATIFTSAPERQKLTLAQSAACLWLAQIVLFTRALEQFESLRTLDSEVLFDRPAEAIVGTSQYLGHVVDEEILDGVLRSEVFTKYSKNPNRQYDNEKRISEKQRAKSDLAEAAAEARVWIEQRAGCCPIPETLGKSLTGESPQLL